MPNAGDLENRYSRQYRYVKPNDTEPGTFRLATPEANSGGDGCTPGGDRCYRIYELPYLGSSAPPAPKSVNISDICIDVPSLPRLV